MAETWGNDPVVTTAKPKAADWGNDPIQIADDDAAFKKFMLTQASVPGPKPEPPRARWDVIGDVKREFTEGVEGVKSGFAKAFPSPDDRAKQTTADREKYGRLGSAAIEPVREIERMGNALSIPFSAVKAGLSPITGTMKATLGSVLSYGPTPPGQDPKKYADEALDTAMMAARPGAGNALTKIASGRETATPAERLVLDTTTAGERGGATTPNRMAAIAAETPDKPVTISDLNKGARDLSGKLHREDTAAGNYLETFLNDRDANEWRRLGLNVDESFGRKSALTTAEEVVAERTALTKPMREEAFAKNQDMTSPKINRLLTRPAMVKAFRGAVEDMRNDGKLVGRPDPELTELGREQGIVTGYGISGGLKLETLDYVKRALDKQIAVAKRDPSTGDYAILTKLRREFAGALDAADTTAAAGPNSRRMFKDSKTGEMVEGGMYKQYRHEFSGPARSLEQLKWGQEALTKHSPEVIARKMASLAPGDAEFVLLGARESLMKEIMNTIRGADTAKVAGGGMGGKPWRTEQIKAMIPDPAQYETFMRNVEAEAMMHASKVDMIGNSATQRRAAADAKSTMSNMIETMQHSAHMAKDAVHGNMLGLAARSLQMAKDRFRRPVPAPVAIEAQRIMNSPLNSPYGPVPPGGGTQGQNFLANLPNLQRPGSFTTAGQAVGQPGAIMPQGPTPLLGMRLAAPPQVGNALSNPGQPAPPP